MSSKMFSEIFNSLEGSFSGFSAVPMVVSSLVSVIVYVITAYVLNSIAYRRGIPKTWMAWVPVGQLCLLGSISDHYQMAAKYNTRNNRKTLFWLQIIMLVLLALMLILATDAMTYARQMDNTLPSYVDMWQRVVLDLKGLVVACLLLLVTAVLTVVMEYAALYDLYRSCDPDSSVVYLVLSIFLSITMPIFLLVVCEKDAGMPQQPFSQQAPKREWKSARRRRRFYARVIKQASRANARDDSPEDAEEE